MREFTWGFSSSSYTLYASNRIFPICHSTGKKGMIGQVEYISSSSLSENDQFNARTADLRLKITTKLDMLLLFEPLTRFRDRMLFFYKLGM